MYTRPHAPSSEAPSPTPAGEDAHVAGSDQPQPAEAGESSPTPHDALFKATFSRPEHARAILRDVLPAALSRRVDWSTLTRCPGSFVNQDLREHHTDLLFSVRLEHRTAYFYLLFEHQSTADRWMLLRLMEYMTRIWRDHLGRDTKATRLPAIVPVLLHHSETGWTCATIFEELLDLEPDVWADVAPYVPAFRIVLDDLSHASDEALRSRAITALGKLVLACLRHARDMPALLRNLGPWSETLAEVRRAPNGMRALALVLRYMFHTADVSREEIRRLVGDATSPAVTEEVVSLAQKLIEEGKQEGIKKGRAEVILKQLRLKFGNLPAPVVARVQAATEAELDRWTERVLTAPTLDAVLVD